MAGRVALAVATAAVVAVAAEVPGRDKGGRVAELALRVRELEDAGLEGMPVVSVARAGGREEEATAAVERAGAGRVAVVERVLGLAVAGGSGGRALDSLLDVGVAVFM